MSDEKRMIHVEECTGKRSKRFSYLFKIQKNRHRSKKIDAKALAAIGIYVGRTYVVVGAGQDP